VLPQGKTTILKQIRLMQDQSFSREEREDSAEILWQNGIQAMQAILCACASTACEAESSREGSR
jgi:hypothetical protein